jgi:peptide deformylase
MKKEDIIILPNEHLRQKSQKVIAVDDSVRRTVADMTNAALDWEDSRPHEISAALAAVQIDRLEKIIIVRSDFEKKEDREFTVLINPEIVKYEGELIPDYEGCLSVKEIYGKVPRHTKIRVRALNLEGKQIRFKAEDFLARVIQHEIDHTNGILFVDHIQGDKEAFYRLDENGDLQPLDYDESIAGSDIFDE